MMKRSYPSGSSDEAFSVSHGNNQRAYEKSYNKKSIIITAIALIGLNIVRTSIPMLKSNRRLLLHNKDSEGCVRNIHIDRFPIDELVPADETSRQVISDTLMSEYEAQIIKRFITSIAGIFRPKKMTQHLIFSGLKNGGYLANIASLSWPIKKHGLQEKVILHLINDSDDENAESFNDIVDNLSLKEKVDRVVRIHDLNGISRIFGQNVQSSVPDVSSLIYPETVEEIVIPYLHVGGQRMRDQLDILDGAVPLFLNQSIATVGVEHTIDVDVDVLLQFFNSMNYRTYFLGKNHLVRIDNLCESVLHSIINRPEFKIPLSTSDPMKSNKYRYHIAPAFYVALAGDRFEAEVRSIQHAYDMLGVYSSQPSNAQDRSRERYSSMFGFFRGRNKKDMILNRERIYTESE